MFDHAPAPAPVKTGPWCYWATTSTVMATGTSGWRRTGTSWIPSVLIGSIQVQLAAVELDAGLGFQRLGHIGRW